MKVQQPAEDFNVRPIGFINSKLNDLKDCPLQESENAPEAYWELYTTYIQGIKDIAVGNKLIILTWFHLADRKVIKCYRRNMVGSEEFGVFSTRSPDRPNPIGLHTVTVLEIVNERHPKTASYSYSSCHDFYTRLKRTALFYLLFDNYVQTGG